LYGGVEVGEQGDGVGALGDDWAGEGEAAEGEDGEVGETHVFDAGRLDFRFLKMESE
jgi:hypothetical protein